VQANECTPSAHQMQTPSFSHFEAIPDFRTPSTLSPHALRASAVVLSSGAQYDPAKVFFTSKLNYLLFFPTPPIKPKLGQHM